MLKQKGFSLIELMVVVIIIGLLSAIALPTYNRYIEKGHLTAAKTALATYNQVLQKEYVKSGFVMKQASDFNNPPLSNANIDKDIYTFAVTGDANSGFDIRATTAKYPSWAYLDVSRNKVYVCSKANKSSCEPA